MTAGALTALSMISSVYGSTLFQIDDSFVIWQAGIAVKLDKGAWVGSSFETWPGVNPPWNPVTSARAGSMSAPMSAPTYGYGSTYAPPRAPACGCTCGHGSAFLPPAPPQLVRHHFTVAGQPVVYETTR
jgi:hypothetical protein